MLDVCRPVLKLLAHDPLIARTQLLKERPEAVTPEDENGHERAQAPDVPKDALTGADALVGSLQYPASMYAI
jgi:hypothetical protein